MDYPASSCAEYHLFSELGNLARYCQELSVFIPEFTVFFDNITGQVV
jgi:hypothetical protein